jgi:hypothetical protein
MTAIRPYMNYETGFVGVRSTKTKCISLQSIGEVLFVEPAPNRKKSGSPTPKQVRGAISMLIKAGLIESHSTTGRGNNQLILKCLLADTDLSVQNKLGTDWAQDSGADLGADWAQHNPNNNAGSQYVTPTNSGADLGTAKTPELGTPPDTVITNTISRARNSTIPDDFGLSDEVVFRLKTGGVPVEVAEYFLDEFKAANESSGKVSFNWAAELVKYCKRWRWRYDKEQSQAGRKVNQSSSGRATKAHERDKQFYQEAIAREQGDQNIHSPSGEVRPQVVVPYRKR